MRVILAIILIIFTILFILLWSSFVSMSAEAWGRYTHINLDKTEVIFTYRGVNYSLEGLFMAVQREIEREYGQTEALR